jgi:hypothetical protein
MSDIRCSRFCLYSITLHPIEQTNNDLELDCSQKKRMGRSNASDIPRAGMLHVRKDSLTVN